MILSDTAIKERGLIEPFHAEKVRRVAGNLAVSFGLSGHGYDIRLGDELREYTSDAVIDPKRISLEDTRRVPVRTNAQGERFVEVAPGAFLLGHSVERFQMPADVMGLVLGKSTVARTGVHLLTTPLEAGWRGYITLELANVSHNWVRVYVEEGIAQVLFFQAPCDAPYDGPYQDQGPHVVLPFGGTR